MLATLRSSLMTAGFIFVLVGNSISAFAIDLTVSLVTGEISLVNPLQVSAPIVGYSINSPSGSLLPGNWFSIANSYDAGSGGPIDLNDEWMIIQKNSEFLVEGDFLGDGGSLAPGQVLSLGLAWDPFLDQDLEVSIADGPGEPTEVTPIYTTFAADFDENLRVDREDLDLWSLCFRSGTCTFGDADDDGEVNGRDFLLWLRQAGSMGPIPPPRGIVGDFNDDGEVTAADYALWRDNRGGTAMLANDDTPGMVDQSDYEDWMTNFGGMEMTGSSTVQSIPEPTSAWLWGVGLLALVFFRTGGRR